MLDQAAIEAVVKQVLAGYGAGETRTIPVGVSNRHVHLTSEHVQTLFGAGHTLTPLRDLSQPGQFACKEQVTLVGPSMRAIERVRVLGPVRSASQVEISRTDAFTLKLNPPVRPSGELSGSAGVVLIGPCGVVELREGCIIANRHIHMSEEEGRAFGFRDGDVTAVETAGGRRTRFYDVQVRVHRQFTLELHVDTDDANAAGLSTGDGVVLVQG